MSGSLNLGTICVSPSLMMGTAFFGDSGFESSANDEWKGKNKAERQNVSTNRQHSFESGVFIARQQLSP